MHISSIFAKILGKTNFQPWEIPEVGQKQKTEKKEEKEREREREKDRKLVITMASYALQRHLECRTQSRLGQKNVHWSTYFVLWERSFLSGTQTRVLLLVWLSHTIHF